MRINDVKRYIKELLEEKQKQRDSTRGSGVYLGENIGAYYMLVGEILLLQNMAEDFKIPYDANYSPFETDIDDEQFNYWGVAGAIGRKDNKS